MPGPSENNAPADGTSEGRNDTIRISRRDALIGAAAAGIAKSAGLAGVAAAETGISIDIADEYEDAEWVMRQYLDGNINNFSLDDDTTMSITYDPMADDEIHGEIALVHENDSEVFGTASEEANNHSQDTATFDANDLWGGGAIDFVEDLNLIDSYDDISVSSDLNEIGDAYEETNEFGLRFRFVSSNGTLTEERIVPITLSVTIPLEFGAAYGVNFGRPYVESWEGRDWESQVQ